MILQALQTYYRRCDTLAPNGWIHKEVDFVVVLDPAGNVMQVNDLREQRDKRMIGKVMLLPNIGKQAQKHTASGTDANLLWDNAAFLFLGIYLTPPPTTPSVSMDGRGLSKDSDGIRASLF